MEATHLPNLPEVTKASIFRSQGIKAVARVYGSIPTELGEANLGDKAQPMEEGQEHYEGHSPKTHAPSACLRMRMKIPEKTDSLAGISVRAFNLLTTIILNSLIVSSTVLYLSLVLMIALSF